MPDRLLLERLAADAWPPLEQVDVDGWRLRASAGVTRRANSALPLSDALPVQAVVDSDRKRGLPPAVQVSDPRTDAALAELGCRRDVDVDVMTAPTSPAASTATVGEHPDDDWLDCWWDVDGRGGRREREVARRMLVAVPPPAAYARVVRDGRTVAVGRGGAHEGHLGVFATAVRPEHRRQGLARDLLRALQSWGASHGARTTYLQVFHGNAAAPALDADEGFTTSHRYHYRTAP